MVSNPMCFNSKVQKHLVSTASYFSKMSAFSATGLIDFGFQRAVPEKHTSFVLSCAGTFCWPAVLDTEGKEIAFVSSQVKHRAVYDNVLLITVFNRMGAAECSLDTSLFMVCKVVEAHN